ncbi:MAG: glycosyltransferase [Thiotrichaceae bacterium]
MRILHLGKYHPPFAGGMENFLADLIPAQIAQGLSVAAIVHNHQSTLSQIFSSVHSETYQKYPVYRVPSYGRILYAPVSPHFIWWLKRAIQQFQPDILHLHLPNTSAFLALLLPEARRIPWVIHWHSDVISQYDQRLATAYHLYRPLEQRLLRKAAAVIVTSPPYLKSSVALQNWQQKCQVIPLGLEKQRLPLPSFTALNWATQQWQPHKFRLLQIGRLTYYKGQSVLIQALNQLDNVHALIVGKGEQHEQLLALITQYHLENKVKLLGYCTDEQMIGLFATSDCFCLPSIERTEAFGMVLLEAMRYGKPVIASDIPGSGVGWVVQDHRTGILFPPQNDLLLARAIEQLQQYSDETKTFGQAGLQRFEQLFDINKVAGQITQVYQSCMAA